MIADQFHEVRMRCLFSLFVREVKAEVERVDCVLNLDRSLGALLAAVKLIYKVGHLFAV